MTEFDEFLCKRNREIFTEARHAELPNTDQGKEWVRLKEQIREITQGKSLGNAPFEWSPYPAPYPDFLKLKDVSVTFLTPSITGLTPRTYRLVFARRPLRANELWVDDEPVPAVRWTLELSPLEGLLNWVSKDEGIRMPTAQFAERVAQRLVEYFDTYTVALRAKDPEFSSQVIGRAKILL
jgi:hypothetical protein